MDALLASKPQSRHAVAMPTIWGLDLIQLHDYYWAARGVQVVRLDDPSTLVVGSELFLLTDHDTLLLFRMRSLVELLSWIEPLVLFGRVHESHMHGYQEHAVSDRAGKLQRFQRSYGHQETIAARVAFTRDTDIARAWQTMGSTPKPWRTLRRGIPQLQREATSIRGHIYKRSIPHELERFSRDIVRLWRHPSATVNRAGRIKPMVWADSGAQVAHGAKFVDNVWVGAGRIAGEQDLVVGPAILWDDPDKRPLIEDIQWGDLEPVPPHARPPHVKDRSSLSRSLKRLFDIAFAFFVLILTLPIYPIVMLAVFFEDGGPFFFTHKRETLGGREFPCLKFRSMRKDAEKIKAQIAAQNQADGPQFFIENDPRLTRVGRFIRKANIDELPQFFNVLAGHMSVVGPRPSPRKENQFCPSWREARLSVRPGITGLWQVNRTRLRGTDFQEWIKYDIEYVENQGWLLDLHIIWKTIRVLIRGVISP
jgi:lipopolysaccharide/colanic/teichoic acid biosynthesis glycosyltransferase